MEPGDEGNAYFERVYPKWIKNKAKRKLERQNRKKGRQKK